MTERKLFNEWYGYDKKLLVPTDTQHSKARTTILRYMTGNWDPSPFITHITETSAEAIIKRFEFPSYRLAAARKWTPEFDSYSESDYINWINSVEFKEKDLKVNYTWTPWYAPKADNYNSILSSNLRNFFEVKVPRSDKLFRIIELSEFMNRATDTQTFEDFLLNDTKYETKCRNLDLSNIGKYKELLEQKSPRFFHFGRGVGQNTRNLFLPLTKSEMDKVIDFENNKLIKSNFNKSYTYEWAELFFKSAFGQHKPLEIQLRSIKEIREYALYRVIEKYEKMPKGSYLNPIDLLMEICHKINYLKLDQDGLRGLSYLINADTFKSLTPSEIVALLCGYENRQLWSEAEKGKSSIEIITEKIDKKEIDQTTICRMIAHIVTNELQPITVSGDFDWSIIKEAPTEWGYALLPISTKVRTGQTPDIISKMK